MQSCMVLVLAVFVCGDEVSCTNGQVCTESGTTLVQKKHTIVPKDMDGIDVDSSDVSEDLEKGIVATEENIELSEHSIVAQKIDSTDVDSNDVIENSEKGNVATEASTELSDASGVVSSRGEVGMLQTDGTESYPINGLIIISGDGSNCPEPYKKVPTLGGANGDLNEDAGGDYMYLCAKYGEDNPITDIVVIAVDDSSSGCPGKDGSWWRVNGESGSSADINYDAGGYYIYLCYQRSPTKSPLKNVYVSLANCHPPTYQALEGGESNGDLNQEAGGEYLNLCTWRFPEVDYTTVCMHGLVYAEGGSSGSTEVAVHWQSGTQSTHTYESSTVRAASISLQGAGAYGSFTGTAQMEASITETVTEGWMQQKTELHERDEVIKVDFDQPCYVYYPVVQYFFKDGGIYSQKGRTYVQVNTPIRPQCMCEGPATKCSRIPTPTSGRLIEAPQPTPTEAFTKMEARHCYHQAYSSYGDMATAKQACLSDHNCIGVYDNGCDGGTFRLCSRDTILRVSIAGSCVYGKATTSGPTIAF